MAKNNPHNATATFLGFTFQSRIFLLQSLKMENCEDYVAMEKEEDISSCIQNRKTYIQAKYSLANDVELSKRDIAKTLAIWIEKDIENNSSFQLVTNRGTKHPLIQYIRETKLDLLINELEKNAECKNNQKLLKNPRQLQKILSKIEIVYEEDIEKTIKDILRNRHYIMESCIDKIYARLLGDVENKYLSKKTQNDKYIQLTHGEFLQITQPIFAVENRIGLVFHYQPIKAKPEEILDCIFVKQLKDLDLDEEHILQANEEKENFEINLLTMIEHGTISERNIQELDDLACKRWKIWFDKHYMECKCSKEKALSLYFQAREDNGLTLAGEDLKEKSGHEFLSLSDKPKIGWHYDWKDRYGKK